MGKSNTVSTPAASKASSSKKKAGGELPGAFFPLGKD